MEKKDQKNQERFDLAIKIILVIIIILLLVHNCVLINKKDDIQVPTGNIDIIEIKCDSTNQCNNGNNEGGKIQPINNNENSNKTTNKNNQNNNDNDNESNTVDDNEEEEPDYDFGVVDDEHNKITWNGATNLKIFTNSAYKVEGVIAPETSNTYEFIVKNGTDYTLKYNITFNENNPYNIDMRYRLKKNGVYIISDYVTYNELIVSDQILNLTSNDIYELDWKWFSGDNDTEAGKNQGSYSLDIYVEAESTNE